VRKVDAAGRITTVAGNGQSVVRADSREVDPGDGEAATGVALAPTRVAVDALGNVYATEWGRGRVRRVAVTGIITTVAGNGTGGLGGDGGPANRAQLLQPAGVAFDRSGNVYISDTGDGRIRKVSPGGTITSLPQELHLSGGIAVDGAGRLYAMISGGVVVRIDPDGLVTRWAGGGTRDPIEGERATNGWIPQMSRIAVDGSEICTSWTTPVSGRWTPPGC
jgi:streptogramin lyase